MKIAHIIPAAYAALCLALTPAAFAQDQNNEAAHNALRALRDTMQTALNQQDIDTLLQHVSEDVVFTTMNGDRVVGKAGIRAYFDKMLKGDKPLVKSVTTQFEVEALSHLYSDNTAVAYGHSTDAYELSDGKRFTVTPQWSATMVRNGEDWQIANFHYSVNMFDNPVLTMQRQWLLGTAAGAALLGLGLGTWIGRRKRQK